MSEAGRVTALIGLCVVLSVQAGPVIEYLPAAAQNLACPAVYIEAVMAAQSVRLPEGGTL